MTTSNTKTIVLGGGCFWCLDAFFVRVRGVVAVVSGYAGGDVVQPSYEQVSNGTTGHAEVVQLTYDADVISLETLVHIFFTIHNPTTLNQQGADIGTQYRSIILYADADEQSRIEIVRDQIESEYVYDTPIVTQVVPLDVFYPAEDYHQNYFAKNPAQAYCQMVILPKLQKHKQELTQYLNE